MHLDWETYMMAGSEGCKLQCWRSTVIPVDTELKNSSKKARLRRILVVLHYMQGRIGKDAIPRLGRYASRGCQPYLALPI